MSWFFYSSFLCFYASTYARFSQLRTHPLYVPYNYILLAIMLTFCFVSTSFQPIYVLLLGTGILSVNFFGYLFVQLRFIQRLWRLRFIFWFRYFCHLPNWSIIQMTDLMVSMNKVLLNAKLAFSFKSHLWWSEFQTIIVRKYNN